MVSCASAYLCSPFDEAAILTVDGVGEWVTATYGVGRGNDIRLSHQIEFPHSVGLLYSAFTAFLGFEVNEGEYKVMGMAPYGQPRYVDKVWKLVHQNADGSFSLDMDYFCFHHSTDRTFNGRFVELFGEPRPAKLNFFTAGTGFPKYFGQPPSNYNELCRLNQHYADIAASIQKVTEELLVGMAKHLYKQTGLERLCIAGGVGLNSVANSRILRETPFEELFIQPSAGDGGGKLACRGVGSKCVLDDHVADRQNQKRGQNDLRHQEHDIAHPPPAIGSAGDRRLRRSHRAAQTLVATISSHISGNCAL